MLDSLIKSSLTFIAICCKRLQDLLLERLVHKLLHSSYFSKCLIKVFTTFEIEICRFDDHDSYCMYNLQFIHIKFVHEKYLVLKF